MRVIARVTSYGRDVWHAWVRTERHAGVWWGNPKERDYL